MLVVACAIALLLPAAAGARSGGAPPEAARAPLAGTPVRVAVERRYAPFLFAGPDGQARGIAVDYLRLVEQDLAVRLDFAAPGELAPLLAGLRLGKLDLHPALASTPARGEFLRFTRPYFSVPAVVVVRSGDGRPRGLDALRGRRVAVGAGYGVEEHLRARHPDLLLVPLPDDEACLRQVLTGEVDAAVVDLASASHVITASGLQGLAVGEDVDFTYELAMGIRADWPDLADAVDGALSRIPEAQRKAIRDRWVTLAPARSGLDPALALGLLALLGTAALAAIVGLGWSRLLRRQVAERTRELAESEERLETLVAHVPAAVAMFDREMRHLVASPRWIRDFQLSGRDVIGRNLHVLLPNLPPHWQEAHRRCLAGSVERCEEEELHQPDGTVDWVRWESHPWRGADGEVGGIVIAAELTTRWKGMRSRLEASSRLAALGTLVAGVAHEVNNPLAGTLSGLTLAIDLLEERVAEATRPGGEPIAPEAVRAILEDLQNAREAAQRVATIVRDLATFARPGARREPVDLGKVVREALHWVEKGARKDVGLQVEISASPEVEGSGSQLSQVVVNLLNNAIRAIPSGRPGHVVVRAGHGVPGMARLEVVDDGVGMSAEVAARVFDPFFTTRETGDGTGMGLAICHAIVAVHGGTIQVQSQPGRGSTFRVELPIATRLPTGGGPGRYERSR